MEKTIRDIYDKVMHKKTQERVSGEEAKKWAQGRNVSDWSDGFDTAMHIAADIICCSYKGLQKLKPHEEMKDYRTVKDIKYIRPAKDKGTCELCGRRRFGYMCEVEFKEPEGAEE